MRLEQIDGGQEPLPLQTVLVQMTRRHVGGGHEGDAVAEQSIEQARKDHGIGDVRDEKFVQTDDPRARGEALRYGVERIAAIADDAQIRMNLTHEAIEMRTLARHTRKRRVEKIHQQRLAAADPSPQVHAPKRLRRRPTQPRA